MQYNATFMIRLDQDLKNHLSLKGWKHTFKDSTLIKHVSANTCHSASTVFKKVSTHIYRLMLPQQQDYLNVTLHVTEPFFSPSASLHSTAKPIKGFCSWALNQPVSWRQSISACTSRRRRALQSGAPWSDDRRGCRGSPGKRQRGTNPSAPSGSARHTVPARPSRWCWRCTSGRKRKAEGRAAGTFCRSPGKDHQSPAMLFQVELSPIVC